MHSTKTRVASVCACALLAAALLFAATGCSDTVSSSANSSTLRVGVRSDIVNFGYLNEQTGKYYGLEIDIAEEMAARMGYATVEFETVTPDNRKEKLLNGDIDCIVACYSISNTRTENFDFSPPYYEDEAVIMVENSSLITTPEQLVDKTIGTVSGVNTAPILGIRMHEMGLIGPDVVSDSDEGTQYQGMYVSKLPTYRELSDALEEGRVDAIALDRSFVATYLDDDRSLIDIDMEPQEYGVATQKGSALSQQVSQTIQDMLDDGTIDAYIEKWN